MKGMYKQKPLNEQVVIITGSSSGIGLACAKKAGLSGARVVITSNNEPELEDARKKLENKGITVESIPADVSEFEAHEKIAGFTKDKFGSIDTWINNAGVGIFGELMDTPVEDARRLFDVNFWGVVHGSKVAVDHMKESGGTIINIGSIASVVPIPLLGIYSASKHAVKAYTNSLRMELEKEGYPVNVTLIKPSSIATPIPEHSKNLMEIKATLPPPVYDPEVAADAIIFCATHPRRSFTIGGVGKTMNYIAKLFPSLWETIMEKTAWKMERMEGARSDKDILYESSDQKAQISDKKDYYYVKKFSLYDTMIKNPIFSAGFFSLAAALLYNKFADGKQE